MQKRRVGGGASGSENPKSSGKVATAVPVARSVENSGLRGSLGRSGSQPPLGGSQPSRFERLPYFKPPALPEVSDLPL
jgi:hypothetical protein